MIILLNIISLVFILFLTRLLSKNISYFFLSSILTLEILILLVSIVFNRLGYFYIFGLDRNLKPLIYISAFYLIQILKISLLIFCFKKENNSF